MAEFINTVDVLGDDVVADSLINRSVSEFKDDSVAKVGKYAFCNCQQLTSIELPAATTILSNAFQNCTKLARVDLPMATEIKSGAFSTCSKLNTIILRNNDICAMEYTSVMKNTPIASGTGYVYVPAALVDSYKAASNWSNYPNQIRAIEDYPEICG